MQRSSGCQIEQGCQRGLQARQQDLGFRVSKAGIEFNDLYAFGGERQPSVEQANKWGTPGLHFSNSWP